MNPSSAVDRYAVIGNPIVQSKSPIIHGLFAAATDQQMEYTKVEGRIGDFAKQLDELRAVGMRGMNVTAPFKLEAFAYATHLSESAKLAGAVNALKFEGAEVHAQNFDGIGLVNDIERNHKTPMKGKRVLLLGAGGAVRGALLPFARCEPALLVVANRTVAKAQELVDMLRTQSAANVQASSYEDLREPFDVIVNGTSASLFGDAPAVPHAAFSVDGLAYEMAYGKGATPFLLLAQAAGARRMVDGVGMLVEQAALAFEWWRGVRPSTVQAIHQLTVPIDFS
ncbi:shikimate dehydrogenase [Variovorax sp. PCZ-1]|uniref:shikimate dehydrogenase n=1 Tax=Variovorax sp. PCZ-1 TaxID=2835533 RepID=UPI001BCF25DD|nr:shikimate dehydrogenase [Variovorax sp. PCZ-1]MBS7806420.1 shikimate dehydrogenase [Variovorax sp. PCZ-1]